MMPWETDGEDWRSREWHECVLEGEWNITQAKVQHMVGPWYEMYRFGREPAGKPLRVHRGGA